MAPLAVRVPQGAAQDGGQPPDLPLPAQLLRPLALHLHLQVAVLVGVHRHPALQPQGGQALLHQPLAAHVHRRLLGQLRRRPVQHGGHVAVLGAHRRPALPHPAVVPPAAQKGGQLPVGRHQEGLKADAAAGKVGREVLHRPRPPIQHGGEGVGQGGFGHLVLPLPAPLLLLALDAHPVRRPVEYAGGIPVVGGGGGLEGGAQPPGHRPEGLGGLLEAPGGELPGVDALLLRRLLAHQGGQPAQELVRQQQEHRRPRRQLPAHGVPRPQLPGPQDGRRPAQGVGRGAHQPALPDEYPRHQAGQGVGQGVVGGQPGGKAHGQPGHHPRRRA